MITNVYTQPSDKDKKSKSNLNIGNPQFIPMTWTPPMTYHPPLSGNFVATDPNNNSFLGKYSSLPSQQTVKITLNIEKVNPDALALLMGEYTDLEKNKRRALCRLSPTDHTEGIKITDLYHETPIIYRLKNNPDDKVAYLRVTNEGLCDHCGVSIYSSIRLQIGAVIVLTKDMQKHFEPIPQSELKQ